jgi:L-aspartate oxidase
MEKEFFDLAVIGRGLAGLNAAIKTKKNHNTAIFFSEKENELKANSFNAQGGIAAAINENDSIQSHFNDTVKAGAGLCNEKAVKILVKKGKEEVLKLIEAGFEFDKRNGLNLGLEAGHSKKRVLHSKGDCIGKELMHYYLKIAKEKNVHFFPGRELRELIVRKGKGKALLFDDMIIEFKAVVFASGGYSFLYSKNTNSGKQTEANSIALNAGIELMDLEFEQFHPTTIKGNNFLLSETLRGEGAFLINELNERFMEKIKGRDLATRDVVSRKVFEEINSGRKVFLDCSGIEDFKERFPSIYRKINELGLKVEEPIEIEPAAHYSIGGIKIDLNARTNIRNVFAAGECSCSGVHGANRLASNSLLEAIVFGSIAGQNALKEKKSSEKIKIKINCSEQNSGFDSSLLQELMWNYVGIERSERGLKKALNEVKKMKKNNYTFLAEKIIESSLNRKESRGCHYRKDFPEKKKRAEHTIIKK